MAQVELNGMGSPISPGSLEGAVRYVAAATGVPVLVTEHGLSTEDDAQRCAFIPEALLGSTGRSPTASPSSGTATGRSWTTSSGSRPTARSSGLHAVDRDTLGAHAEGVVAGLLGQTSQLRSGLSV